MSRHACGYPIKVQFAGFQNMFIADDRDEPEYGEVIDYCPRCSKPIEEVGVLSEGEWQTVLEHETYG